jgi:putative transposase
VGQPHGSKARHGIERVDEMWGADLISTQTGEGGHRSSSRQPPFERMSSDVFGVHPARRATRFETLEPIRQDVRACFGAFASMIVLGMKLRHDQVLHAFKQIYNQS